MSSGRAQAWRDRGSYFSWAPAEGSAPPVDIFHVEGGDPGNPTIVLVHGFPTCSVDWFDLGILLSDRFHVCALDFPGYGFSSKPTGWGYSLGRDAELLDHYLADVLNKQSAIVIAHDRGTSVSLLHTINAAAGHTKTGVDHLVLTNGNIYLPLSNLTDFQRLALDPESWPAVKEFMTPAMLAVGMGTLTYSPPRGAGDPEIDALEATFAHNDGVSVIHETIQYLVERAENETGWLEALGALDTPTSVIWGMNDPVSPPRVALHAWDDFFMFKPGRNRIYLVPDASHYLQNDRPDALVSALSHALDPDSEANPGPIAPAAGAPVLIDASRERMPTGPEVIKGALTSGL
ncbi:MAG TPA: alpha/beta hydrolase [Mycobacteriales bacterium]|nr:alpha/beta hydrolase [Mycobacteriales bacterium]